MQLKKITQFFYFLLFNLTGILFLSGLTLINVAVFRFFGQFEGLIATGVTLILIALLLDHEQRPRKG